MKQKRRHNLQKIKCSHFAKATREISLFDSLSLYNNTLTENEVLKMRNRY